MFIIRCTCGNEIYASNEETRTAWQCDACGKWYDMFGYPAPPEPELPEGTSFMTFDGF